MWWNMKSNYQYYMEADLSGHIGKWIAICGNEIVSEGKDPKKVYGEAKTKCGTKRLLLTKVPKETTMIFCLG